MKRQRMLSLSVVVTVGYLGAATVIGWSWTLFHFGVVLLPLLAASSLEAPRQKVALATGLLAVDVVVGLLSPETVPMLWTVVRDSSFWIFGVLGILALIVHKRTSTSVP